MKYPRIPHVTFSRGIFADDIVTDRNVFGFEVHVTEKLDGCLDENTIIKTEDGLMTIKEICETKYDGKVEGFDIENGKVIFVNIDGYSIQDNNEEWYEIELEDGRTIILTGNHYIWDPCNQKYKETRNLKIGDQFLYD